MDFDFTNDDIEKIKKGYEYDQTLSDPSDIIFNLHHNFEWNVLNKKIDEKLSVLKEKIKIYEGNADQIKTFEDTINKLKTEYDKIMKSSLEDYYFYSTFFNALIYNYKNNLYHLGAKDSFYQTSKDVLDAHVNLYIKNEKKIILINDEIKELFDSLSN